MSERRPTRHPSPVTRHPRKGQTLVIAIMVMFILATIGAVFVAMVARNLFRAARYSDVDVVAQLAEAGIRYADQMLTSSEEGADWRPKPDNDGVEVDDEGVAMLDTDDKPVAASDWQMQRDRYPDFKWTRAWWPTELPAGSAEGTGYAGPSGGYTTFNQGEGRYLLRVSYNPNPKDPYSKYIKIESIGRFGTFLEDDPTTWKPHGNVLLRREVTAYKPIGLTDYVRFITNKNNRSTEFALGAPGYSVKLGRPNGGSSYANWYRGGPIRVNGNLTWYGDPVRIFLRGVNAGTGGGINAATFGPLDMVEVTGDIRIDGLNSSASSSPVRIQVMDWDGTLIGDDDDLWPSDHPDFSTFAGLYRDGRDATDADGRSRGVKRIEAPLVDQTDPTNSVGRYALLTLYSGQRITNPAGSGRINLGEWGWGRGIYINNRADRQDDSETLFGGFTLRTDWLKPGLFMGNKCSGWVGPAYIPPGVIITLHPNDTDGDDQPDLTITRSDTVSRGRKFVWRDAWGEPRPEWGGTIAMPYPDPKHGRTIVDRGPDGSIIPGKELQLDGNGVIYAEGNIRIRGMLPKEMQLTVVSNETIYIEGNLLKYRDPAKPTDTGSGLDPWRGADSSCGLALLARESICVNTTQFFSPLSSISADNVGSDAQNGTAPYHVIIGSSPESRMHCRFDFGPWESETVSTSPAAWTLFVRHAGQYGPTYINAWLNPMAGSVDFGLLHLNIIPGAGGQFTTALPPYVLGIGDPRFDIMGGAPGFYAPGWGVDENFMGCVIPLDTAHNVDSTFGNATQNLFTRPGFVNNLLIGLDQNIYTRNNYLMGGLAIQPMDIRIEAVCYAQEGSFYVLPGTWFNPNPADTRAAYGETGHRPAGVNPLFPFYGDALDVRVIVDGAVSENIPAPIGDVEEWMAKWGSIPPTYGSSSTPTAHPAEGFTILYDDHAGWPLKNLRQATPAAYEPIRTDKFGRVLPFAPKLPVSGSLLYFGDVM